MITRYVLRADLAYDWNFSIDDLALDTLLYKEAQTRVQAKQTPAFNFWVKGTLLYIRQDKRL